MKNIDENPLTVKIHDFCFKWETQPSERKNLIKEFKRQKFVWSQFEAVAKEKQWFMRSMEILK